MVQGSLMGTYMQKNRSIFPRYVFKSQTLLLPLQKQYFSPSTTATRLFLSLNDVVFVWSYCFCDLICRRRLFSEFVWVWGFTILYNTVRCGDMLSRVSFKARSHVAESCVMFLWPHVSARLPLDFFNVSWYWRPVWKSSKKQLIGLDRTKISGSLREDLHKFCCFRGHTRGIRKVKVHHV